LAALSGALILNRLFAGYKQTPGVLVHNVVKHIKEKFPQIEEKGEMIETVGSIVYLIMATKTKNAIQKASGVFINPIELDKMEE
jgi:hypothetical protein